MRILFIILLLFFASQSHAETKAVEMKSDTQVDTLESDAEDSVPENAATEDAYSKAYEACLSEADAKTKTASEETADALYKDIFKKCMTAQGHEVPNDDDNTKTDE